jgi:hypothetical protein
MVTILPEFSDLGKNDIQYQMAVNCLLLVSGIHMLASKVVVLPFLKDKMHFPILRI